MPFLRSKTDAVSARGQVGSEHDTGGALGRVQVNPGDYGKPVHATLQIWVEPEGAPPPELRTVTLQNGLTLFESHLSTWGGKIERMGSGRWTYVQYRTDRPHRCEIDEQRLTREFGDLYGGKQRLLIPKETSDTWFAPAVTPEPSAAPAGDAVTPTATPPDGLVAGLAQLAQLREAGTLSDTEFAAAKARLLGQNPPT